MSRRRSNAGTPARSWMTLSVARVTTYAWPTGRQPWETTVPDTTPESRSTPTAPLSNTASSRTRRFPPGARPVEAMPPTTCRVGAFARRRSSMPSVGMLKGSANSRSTRGLTASVSAGRPVSAHPPLRRWVSKRTGSTGPTLPAQRLMAGRSSTSRPPPTIDEAVTPMRARGRRAVRTVSAISAIRPRWAADTKSTARSGASPTCSRTSPTTSPAAWVVSGCSEMAAPKFMTLAAPAWCRAR